MCRQKQNIFLIGIGPGDRNAMTGEALEAIRLCECLIGAARMLEAVREDNDQDTGREEFCEYRTDQILSFVREHPDYKNIGVLLSGDTGFYSGAALLEEKLSVQAERYEVKRIPGIASVLYFAARLGVTWEDASIVSLHGQDPCFIQTVNRSRKTFILLGGKDAGKRFLKKLSDYGMDHVTVWIGTRLSYPDETVISGHPGELNPDDAGGLCLAFVSNPQPDILTGPHLPDDLFIRGKVPMTKQEVRSVSIAQLELTRDAVLYDIGAGTGSVSVEAALSGDGIRVYAVEKKEEAVELLKQNRKKFRTDGIRIVEGEAPDALIGLEPPTHVFIGGSSGNLREILKVVRRKNPSVRIVLNAVSMETVKEAMEAVEEGLLPDARITQISASRARMIGRYHMMTGQNPVYIISSGKENG